MRMTAEIFFTVWEREHKTARAAAGRSPVILRHIQLLNEKGDPRLYEEDVLYVCGSELFTGDEDGPSCAVDEKLSGATLLSAVTDCWNRIFAWDHHICERILNGQSAEKILPLGKECLPYPYMLVDREMQVLYRTADYREEIGEPEETFLRGNMIPPELVQSLLLSKKFHEAALRPSAFYYYENQNDRRNYCRNIFLDGQYYARLLMLLPENAERFLPGEEELFDLFADRTEQLCMRDARLLRRKRADSLHQVCKCTGCRRGHQHGDRRSGHAAVRMDACPYFSCGDTGVLFKARMAYPDRIYTAVPGQLHRTDLAAFLCMDPGG